MTFASHIQVPIACIIKCILKIIKYIYLLFKKYISYKDAKGFRDQISFIISCEKYFTTYPIIFVTLNIL